jgi:DNA processing protein
MYADCSLVFVSAVMQNFPRESLAMVHNHWTCRDILALMLSAKIKAGQVREYVETYHSFAEYAQSRTQNELAFDMSVFDTAYRKADEQIALCARYDVAIITWWDTVYPTLLKEIYYPPTVLYVQGQLQSNDAIGIGMVGTRHCTQYGKLTAERFAQTFAEQGVIVVSGLAYGIDAIAHKSVVKSKGITYAVIASGIDCISPAIAQTLARDIVATGGAIISEYPCGTKALPAYFPQRNRIISGIAQATVVVESDVRGGSLITAQFAIDQNRDLFAVPGNVSSDKSRGTNMLIKRGSAGLVMSPDDVLEALNIIPKNTAHTTKVQEQLSQEDQALMQYISHEPIHIDTLAQASGKPTHSILVTLMELEFKELVRQLPGKSFIRL